MQPGRNPFSRMIILDYYDGPMSGAAQCPSGLAFRFEMLAWDDRQDTRVFSLTPLPPGRFAALTVTLSRLGEPRWPVWAPNWDGVSQDGEPLEREVERALDGTQAPEWVVAWHDLERDGLLAARRVGSEDRNGAFVQLSDQQADRDWFTVLGLAK